jgi:hypothetical protein
MHKRGYDGLDILLSTAFPRPVQIVRQFISNHDTLIAPYHRYKGLSSLLKMAGNRKDRPYPYWYNKPYMPDVGICGYKGLKGLG